MTIKSIDIDKIDTFGRLREKRQDWVDAFAERIAAGGELPAIEVVERSDGGYRLITGLHRLAAHAQAGRTTIEANLLDPASYADEAACRLREIEENVYRVGLTELDRCVAVAEWKAIYEKAKTVRKHGGDRRSDHVADSATRFVERFSTAAATVLGISERSVYVAVNIATGIDEEVRTAIALHPIADQQADLLLLAQQSQPRQQAIAALLLDPDAGIGSVAEAIAAIDKTPRPSRAAPWERVVERFVRMKQKDQDAFFEAMADTITLWLARRAEKPTNRR